MCLAMPLFGGKHKADKAKLEEKLRIARETPEPIFDLSGCSLPEVPKIFSLCKVFRKESLVLSENYLTSLAGGGNLADLALLTLLDISSNKFAELPKNIGECLPNLKYLVVNKNKLKSLPDSIGKMKYLERLLASDNRVQTVPESLANLGELRELDLSRNHLKDVPVGFSKLRKLRDFFLEGNESIVFPDTSVISEGCEAVMRAICERGGVEYVKPDEEEASPSGDGSLGLPGEDRVRRRSCHDAVFEAEKRAIEHDTRKRDRQREMLETEVKLKETARLEAEAVAASLVKSKQMISRLAEENRVLDEKIKRVQERKEKEREELLRQITDVERHSNELIVNLIAVNDSSRKAEADAVLDEMLQARIELEDYDKLRRREVLEEMESRLSSLLEREVMALSENARLANEVVKTALEQDVASNEKIMDVIKSRSGERQQLIKKIVTDEDMQRQMLLSLIMERDSHRVAISGQVEAVLEELAALSKAEAKQRDLRVETQAVVLESKRKMLSELLSALIVQKQEREAELAKRLQEMEAERQEQQEGYWLMQYQRLLDTAPEAIKNAEVAMDWVLKDILLRVGAQKYLPHFAKKRLTAEHCLDYEKEDFMMLGVRNDELIAAIMKELAEYKEEQRRAQRKMAAAGGNVLAMVTEPSAPPLDVACSIPPGAGSSFVTDVNAEVVVREEASFVPSAPPAALSARIEEECVVCMERKCEMVFLLCGHVCCCKTCAGPLSVCPLCRAVISTRILLIASKDG